MRCEDFTISFDIYVPSSTYEKGANVQFSFYETEDFTPIFSKWYAGSIVADEWVTITGSIDTLSGDVDYSGFVSDPEDWIFDAVRIQTIINGENVGEGEEILFYVDNLTVNNFDLYD